MRFWNLAKAMADKAWTVKHLAEQMQISEIDKPNLRTALNSAVRSGLATKHQRRVAGRLTWIYKWRM